MSKKKFDSKILKDVNHISSSPLGFPKAALILGSFLILILCNKIQ